MLAQSQITMHGQMLLTATGPVHGESSHLDASVVAGRRGGIALALWRRCHS